MVATSRPLPKTWLAEFRGGPLDGTISRMPYGTDRIVIRGHLYVYGNFARRVEGVRGCPIWFLWRGWVNG